MWAFGPCMFPDLDTILDEAEPRMATVLGYCKIRAAFKSEYCKLIDFLKEHLKDLTEVALGLTDDTAEVVAAAFFCLTTPTTSFTTNTLTNNRAYVELLLNFLGAVETPTDYNLLAFAALFSFLVDRSTGFVFLNVTDKPKLFRFLLEHIENTSILDCVIGIVTNKGQPILQFLETARAIPQVMEMLDEPDSGHRHTRLLLTLKIIFERIFQAQRTPQTVKEQENREKLYKLMMESEEPWVRRYAAETLLAPIKVKIDNNSCPDDALIEYSDWLATKEPALVEAICKGDSYDIVKSTMVMMIVDLNLDGQTVVESVVGLCKYLFDLMFKLDACTILHNDFLAVFQTSWQHVELVESCNLLKRIPEAFAFYRKNHAVYWNILYSIAELIVPAAQAGRIKVTPEWTQFVEETYNPMYELIRKTEYGGPLPSEEYSYEEEEEEEEEDDIDL